MPEDFSIDASWAGCVVDLNACALIALPADLHELATRMEALRSRWSAIEGLERVKSAADFLSFSQPEAVPDQRKNEMETSKVAGLAVQEGIAVARGRSVQAGMTTEGRPRFERKVRKRLRRTRSPLRFANGTSPSSVSPDLHTFLGALATCTDELYRQLDSYSS